MFRPVFPKVFVVVGGWDHSKIRRFRQRCKKNYVLVVGHSSVLCAISQLLVAVPIAMHYFFLTMHYTMDGC